MQHDVRDCASGYNRLYITTNMGVKYKLVQRGKPGDPAADKKYYGQVKYAGRKTLKQISKDIADISSLSYGDITNVLNNLVLQIPKYLADEFIIYLGDPGSMRLSIKSEGTEIESAFNPEKIKTVKIFFRPGRDLKHEIQNIKFEK